MIESHGIQGFFAIYVNGKLDKAIKNRITSAWRNAIRDAMSGDSIDLELKYLALGTSDAALSDASTQLGNEQFRTTFLKKEKTSTGQIVSTAIALDNEAVFNIREIGIFAGSATSAANSGILVSRVLYNRDKTNLESIQFVRTDNIQRG